MCGDAHQVDPARIDDDQLGALAQPALHAARRTPDGLRSDWRRSTTMTSAFIDRVEVLRAGRLAERLLQAVAGGRVADAGAGVDVVVAEGGAHQLLDEVGLFVRAARRGDAADGVAAVLRLDALELAGGVADRLVPARPRATGR